MGEDWACWARGGGGKESGNSGGTSCAVGGISVQRCKVLMSEPTNVLLWYVPIAVCLLPARLLALFSIHTHRSPLTTRNRSNLESKGGHSGWRAGGCRAPGAASGLELRGSRSAPQSSGGAAGGAAAPSRHVRVGRARDRVKAVAARHARALARQRAERGVWGSMHACSPPCRPRPLRRAPAIQEHPHRGSFVGMQQGVALRVEAPARAGRQQLPPPPTLCSPAPAPVQRRRVPAHALRKASALGAHQQWCA